MALAKTEIVHAKSPRLAYPKKGVNELKPVLSAETSNGELAHAALLARLAEVDRKPIKVRAPQSLQPTPEAAKTRAARLRKKRLLIQRSKRRAHSGGL